MIALVLALCLVAPNEAAARAEAHFAAQEYERAVDALREAYAIEPDPAFVFAEGSALQALGRLADAIEAYERFLALAPPKPQAQKAYERIQACRAELERERPVDRVPPPADAPPPEVTTTTTDEVPSTSPPPDDSDPVVRPWHRDIAGGVLLGAGLTFAATGGALVGVGATRHSSAADDAMTEGSLRNELRGTVAMQGVGISLAVTGGALLVGAIVRYAIVRRRQKSTSSSHHPQAVRRGWPMQPHPLRPG